MPEENLHKEETGQEDFSAANHEGETIDQVNEEQKDDAAKQPEETAGEQLDLAARLASKEKEAEELFSRLQRLQADFENFKRRSRKELEDMARFGIERLIVSLLPVMDNFNRALSASAKGGEGATFMAGMEMIYRQLKEVLEKEGLQAIEAVGQPFNPEKHEAVMQVETENPEQDNLVTEELQTGYTLHDRLLRPSMVKVAKYNG